MEFELEKRSPLKPASFEQRAVKLTDAQKMLLKLLIKKASKNEMISREEMVDFYIKHIKKSETFIVQGRWETDWDTGKSVYRYYLTPVTKRWRDEYNFNVQAYQWFKNNLGSVIMKGKVLIVPVFED